jgi:hypothetical protein
MKNRISKYILMACVCMIATFYLLPHTGLAQLWQPIPPYNVLWPLWSPILSPPNPLTGVPTPLITSLNKDTYLPIQPALVWDPSLPYYYLLYNYIPVDGGLNELIFFDPTEGAFNPVYSFKVWPPATLLEATVTTTLAGTTTTIGPSPIALPTGYGSLISFDPTLWLNFWIPLVNTAYQNLYGIFPNLLTAGDILPTGYTFTGSFAPAI